jgi:hypothetical protein
MIPPDDLVQHLLQLSTAQLTDFIIIALWHLRTNRGAEDTEQNKARQNRPDVSLERHKGIQTEAQQGRSLLIKTNPHYGKTKNRKTEPLIPSPNSPLATTFSPLKTED